MTEEKKPFLLFDFDGTIVDSMKLGLSIAAELHDNYGFNKIDAADIEYLKTKSLSQIFRDMGLPFYRLPMFVKLVKKLYHERCSQLEPIPGMLNTIAELNSKGINMALLTSNSKDNVKPFLEKHQLNYFLWYRCDVGLFNKTRCIKDEIRKHDLRQFDVHYIGDEIRDVRAAKKCRIKSIAVSWGFQSRDSLKKQSPDYLIDSPGELLKIFGKDSA